MGRDEEIAYAREHGIPVKGGTEAAPYSIDDNLWGRSSEGSWIEDLDARARGRRLPARHPAARRRRTSPRWSPSAFERGVPVALNGERLELVELLERSAEIGARHGVGIVDHIEDRIVGLKVRDIYEVPAAAIILPAHAELEHLAGTIHQNQFKPALDQQWAYLVYAGLWWEPLRTDLDAYMDGGQRAGHRHDRARALQGHGARGHARVAERRLRRAARDASPSPAGCSRQTASPGFIELWSLQSRMAWRLRNSGELSSCVFPPERVGRVVVFDVGLRVQADRLHRLERCALVRAPPVRAVAAADRDRRRGRRGHRGRLLGVQARRRTGLTGAVATVAAVAVTLCP